MTPPAGKVSADELAGHIGNGFCLLKQDFLHSLTALCESVAADICCVMECLRYDVRIALSATDNVTEAQRSTRFLSYAAEKSRSPMLGHAALVRGEPFRKKIQCGHSLRTHGRARGPARVGVIGAGYVGLTTAACLAWLGHNVVCSDVDAAKVARLRQGRIDLVEPGLAAMVRDGLATRQLAFSADSAAVAGADVVFLCVPTPMGSTGEADLGAVVSAVRKVRALLPSGCVLVCKSTVPVGTAARVTELLGRDDVAVASNPEFLREGSAVRDFLHPDRIVVGTKDPDAAQQVVSVYARLDTPTLVTGTANAEMVKYAANGFLAMKLSYVNAAAQLCERLDVGITEVTRKLNRDSRMGRGYLQPGPGWGGSCLPKDTRALLRLADTQGTRFPALQAAIEANARQHEWIVHKVVCATSMDGSLRGVRLGLLGLSFKAGTHDLRDSAALTVARLLADHGAELTAYDPGVRGDEPGLGYLTLTGNAYQTAKGAAALVLLTGWPQFRTLDWARVASLLEGSTVIDTRNLLDPERLRQAGISWHGIGHPRSWPATYSRGGGHNMSIR